MLNLDSDIVLTVTQTKSSIQNQLYESMRLGTIPKGHLHGNREIPVNFQQERVSKKSYSYAWLNTTRSRSFLMKLLWLWNALREVTLWKWHSLYGN